MGVTNSEADPVAVAAAGIDGFGDIKLLSRKHMISVKYKRNAVTVREFSHMYEKLDWVANNTNQFTLLHVNDTEKSHWKYADNCNFKCI